jgi:hypothetical protein
MRLSWNEIRIRAATFAREWADEGYEKGQTQLFYQEFFNIFGVSVRRVASFEEPVKNLGDKRGFIDLFWKGVLLVEQKSMGRSLVKAKQQALKYFPGLKESELPRYILLSDFQSFELYDLDEGEEISFSLSELPNHVEHFGFILGIQRRTFKDQDPVNIEASELVGNLHDALRDAGYTGHALEQFLVRIVFCLFADDTGIFEPRGIFLDLIENRTREDGSDLGGWLTQLFQVLDTPEDQRQRSIDDDLLQFPYIDGDLFRDFLRVPFFTSEMRKRLIEASNFDWSNISPAIFGALFQSVMKPEERRAQGAHYTTEKNILKVIEPLFLDDLRAEFEKLKKRKDTHRRKLLREFHLKLSKMTFFDPACGCGNFLIIAYRELRELEIELIRELRAYNIDPSQQELDATELSLLNVDQFYGIEISEFPVRIAETALWMMDHIMNNRLSLEFGESYVRIPLRRSPHILNADALEVDWGMHLPPGECSFVFGNPPFVGSKYQSKFQREQVRRIAALGGSGGTLDYVTAWFISAAYYVKESDASIGFVATNSITQGEQVAQLWPILFGKKLEIAYAHQTFAWGSDARGKAHVHVVILGLSKRDDVPSERRLFIYEDINGEPHESAISVISPYLFDAGKLANPHVVVREESRPINGLPPIRSGSQPIDGGFYIFNEEQRDELLREEPLAEIYLHPYIGTQEYLHGNKRWILALQEASPSDLKKMPLVVERMRDVRKYRSQSTRKSTLAIADYPEKYNVTKVPTSAFLAIPEVSSERREYIPIGWLEPPVIPSNKIRFLENATLWQFGILTSAMHMSWTRHIGGRLESRFQYGIGLNYNTFPMPLADEIALHALDPLAQAVLDVRAKYPDTTLADLYDPDLMPSELRKAHRKLDKAVDRLYRKEPFHSDQERAEFLLGEYEKLVAPLTAEAGKEKRRRRKN